jgi:NADH-quinone oxidoreductase subunit A
MGLVLGLVTVALPLLRAPRGRGQRSADTYECGVETVGSAWVRFSIAYYLFALIFVVFEVDVLYLVPVATVLGGSAHTLRDLIEVALFVGILSLAIVFAWRKGVFREL